MAEHIFAIIWNFCLLMLFLTLTGALIYIMLTLSSFAWPLALLAVVAIVIAKLVK